MTSNAPAAPAPRERWYDDACGSAHALELLGERWALLVVRELMFGPRRFGELRGALPGISANILAQRLLGLESDGILVRRTLPSPANVQVYELTPWGYEAEPILQTSGRWAARSPSHDPSLPVSAATVMLSFRTMFDARKAAGMTGTVGVRFPDDGFVARVANGTLRIAREDASSVAKTDAVLACAPATMTGLAYGGLSISAAEKAGHLEVEGDRALARRWLSLFRLPAKVSAVRSA